MSTDIEYLHVNVPLIESGLQSEDSNNIASLSEDVVRIQTLRNCPYICLTHETPGSVIREFVKAEQNILNATVQII
jgi:hypothetical protein